MERDANEILSLGVATAKILQNSSPRESQNVCGWHTIMKYKAQVKSHLRTTMNIRIVIIGWQATISQFSSPVLRVYIDLAYCLMQQLSEVVRVLKK